ncbi:MAG: hypothetical protein KGJ80_12465 [Chloroflexota bacterium]|nr:hypothetical protein [Chloroflexota bacterium]
MERDKYNTFANFDLSRFLGWKCAVNAAVFQAASGFGEGIEVTSSLNRFQIASEDERDEPLETVWD